MDGFPFVLSIDVRFRDLDAFGHVNNAVYLTYLESARMAWWFDVVGSRALRDVAMILARTEIDYRRQVRQDTRLDIGVRCASMRRSSFVLEFRVAHAATGETVAEARKVLVHYDFAADKSSPIPTALRARLRAHDPGLREE